MAENKIEYILELDITDWARGMDAAISDARAFDQALSRTVSAIDAFETSLNETIGSVAEFSDSLSGFEDVSIAVDVEGDTSGVEADIEAIEVSDIEVMVEGDASGVEADIEADVEGIEIPDVEVIAEGDASGRTIFIGAASGDMPRDKFIDSVLDYVRIYADMTSLLALFVDHDVMISQVAASLVRTREFEPKEFDDTLDVPFEVCEDACKEDETC